MKLSTDKLFSGIVILMFVLGCDRATAQGDTTFVISTIHIAKPDIKAHVEVSEEYAVYLKQNDAPKLGHLNGSKLKYIKSKDLRSFGQNEENPMPIVSASYFIKNSIRDTAGLADHERIYDDGWPNIPLHDSVADLSKYLEDTTHFTFPSKESHRIDTVQLKIVLDKKGNYHYSFASKQDSLNEGGEKCIEALTSIHKWQPAHVFRERHPLFRVQTKKISSKKVKRAKRLKAYSEILVTVVLSTDNLSGGEESTKK